MPEINVTVQNRITAAAGHPEIVCGNSDYAVTFAFDAEWDAYPVKTARVVWRDLDTGERCCTELLFEGSRVELPPFYRTNQILLGVYAGDIRTTVPVRIPCCAGIYGDAVHPDPPPDIYTQLLRYQERLLTEQTCAGSAAEFSQGTAGISGTPMNEEAI